LKKPYRLAERSKLVPEPPFTPASVCEMLLAAMRGRAVVRLDEQAVNRLTGTLNARHRIFLAAQEDRERAARRDRAVKLIAELRETLPAILADQQKSAADDFFVRATRSAATALCSIVLSDLVETALPPITLAETVANWQWCGRTLHEDAAALIGSNAAIRFLLASAIPLLSGERPTTGSIAAWLRQRKEAA
jgi:hypothetical protein